MKVAILIDGSFFQIRFYKANNRNPSADDVLKMATKILEDSEFNGDRLLRIYYYDCYPFDEIIKHPITGLATDYKETPVYRARKNFLRNLACKPKIALRSGKLSFGGWNISGGNVQTLKTGGSFVPEMLECKLEQKEVDVKIGLDIAWLSSKGIVDKIVLVTADSDFVPAMIFARREGAMIHLVNFGHKIKAELREHSDGIIELTL